MWGDIRDKVTGGSHSCYGSDVSLGVLYRSCVKGWSPEWSYQEVTAGGSLGALNHWGLPLEGASCERVDYKNPI